MKKKAAVSLFICIVILLIILLRTFVFEILKVSGTSMEPAIHNGQTIFTSKLYFGLVNPFSKTLLFSWKTPEPGDVVLYNYNGRSVIKRCAATEGTHLEYSLDSGYTLIVGENSYPLTETQYHYMFLSETVPEGTILCIGDNTSTSIDSRNYGFIPTEKVIGKVKCR